MNSNEEKKEEHPRHCGHWGRGRRILFVPLFLLAIAVKVAVFMVVWNHVIPELFHGPLVTYWQALGLVVLAKLLVGMGGFRHFGGFPHGGPFGRHGRWAHMSPEEREKLREEIRKRFHE